MAGKKNSGILCKTARLELVRLYNEKKPQFPYDELSEMNRQISRVKNRTVQIAWEWNGFKKHFHDEHSAYPDIKEHMEGYKRLDGYVYNVLKDSFPMMYSSNLNCAIQSAVKAFEDAEKKINEGERSIISFRTDCPLEIYNKCIRLNEEKGRYYVSLKVFSKKYTEDKCYSENYMKFAVRNPDESRKAIIDRCMSGEYKIGASDLIYKKGKWFLNLAYEFKPEKSTDFVEGRVMGIDLGIKCVAYMSFNDCKARDFIGRSQVNAFRAQVEARKRALQRQGKYCGEGRIGHGYETRNKPVLKITDAIARFRDTVNHQYSRYIVEFALRNKCGVIQMEKLDDIAKDDKFLKDWTYFDLQQKIEHKAEAEGMKVKYVKPQYTSQRCSRCGHISAENRPKEEKGQAYFRCVECDFKENADYNASQNLADPDIEKKINEELRAKAKRTKKD